MSQPIAEQPTLLVCLYAQVFLNPLAAKDRHEKAPSGRQTNDGAFNYPGVNRNAESQSLPVS
ncbi:hypothetical protein HPTD01_3010 [Halomonas sp. TD01]|nr:hypothetical protein HPTD01_3010 [Halomonas sp. TD01]